METYLSVIAILISVFALIMTRVDNHNNGRPYLRLESIIFVPSEFICYSNSDTKNHKYFPLSEHHLNIISQTKQKATYVNIDDKQYLLINLLDMDSDSENVRLILSPMICVYTNTGAVLNEIEFGKARTQIKSDLGRVIRYKVDCKIAPSNDKEIVLRIAYACREGQSTSLLYNRLMEIKEGFDYLRDRNRAREIVNFLKEDFRFTCKNFKKQKYRMRTILTMDNNGLKSEVK